MEKFNKKSPQKKKKKSELKKFFGFYKNILTNESEKNRKRRVIFSLIGGTIHTDLI